MDFIYDNLYDEYLNEKEIIEARSDSVDISESDDSDSEEDEDE